MKSNYTYCAILIYIIVMISLVLIKPQFIYDKNKKQYKKFGYTNGKITLSLPVVSIIVAILIGLIFTNIGKNNDKCHDKQEQNNNRIIKYEYVKVPVISSDYFPFHTLNHTNY